MAKIDKLHPAEPTPKECAHKATSLRQMATTLAPGVARDRALHMAELWQQKRGKRPAAMKWPHKPAGAIDPSGIPGAVKAPPPAKIAPQLATLTKAAPAGDEWLHEIKFDGYRILAHIAGGKARLISRNGLTWTVKLPKIAAVLPGLSVSEAILDGEVCHVQANGVTSFGALQKDISDRHTGSLVFFLFDILYLDGWRLDRCGLVDRKALLERILATPHDKRLCYSEHHTGNGHEFFTVVANMGGVEGIVSKRADARYIPGRGGAWLKVKALGREELIILGYTDPAGSRIGFGGLVLGYRAGAPGGALTYAGTVGTGFSNKLLKVLHGRLTEMGQAEPNAKLPKGYKHGKVHWVRPELVGEVAFTEWTRDGVLRHPSFLCLREDKAARDVVLDRALAPDAKVTHWTKVRRG